MLNYILTTIGDTKVSRNAVLDVLSTQIGFLKGNET